MAGRGLTLDELQNAIGGHVSVRIAASRSPEGQWVTAHWPCGCRAEGYRLKELLLLERCLGHRSIRLVELAAAAR